MTYIAWFFVLLAVWRESLGATPVSNRELTLRLVMWLIALASMSYLIVHYIG